MFGVKIWNIHTTSREVSNAKHNMFFKIEILYSVRTDGGSEFKGASVRDPHPTHSFGSIYSFEQWSCQKICRAVQIVAKKNFWFKRGFQWGFFLLNNTPQRKVFSPSELFYHQRPCSFLSDLICDVDIEEGMCQHTGKRIHLRRLCEHAISLMGGRIDTFIT